MGAYCCDVFGQGAGLVPGVCLFSEVFDAVGVDVGGAGFRHGGFSALLLYLSGLLVRKALMLRGFASETDLLHDLGELFFQRPVGKVGPFACTVRAAAAEWPMKLPAGPQRCLTAVIDGNVSGRWLRTPAGRRRVDSSLAGPSRAVLRVSMASCWRRSRMWA